MKIFAYYLPQFHCIPENDEWWGKGFTEWTNVKKAIPLFKNHNQPKVPLNDNYYSLENVNTLKWQKDLMDKYKVDGLIFYHYYFTGKKLLEKPAEMLLKNKDIKMNFFFCWANHSWFRSWEGSKELLLEQKYGEKEEWEEHFNYLLPFFLDERYEKKDNKPIFMVFDPKFQEKKEMFNYFDRKCKENGFDGICIIETYKTYKINECQNLLSNQTEYIHLREPDTSTNTYRKKISKIHKRIINKIKTELGKRNFKTIKKYSGNSLYKVMLEKDFKDTKIIRGSFFEWDNTPRHAFRGYIITSPDKKMFFRYMDMLSKNDYMFVNAWNEWCEGMILEPTKENGYKYLEWIKEWREKL